MVLDCSEDLCACKQLKGKRLYNLFSEWANTNNEEIKPFEQLDSHVRLAWLMTALGKKKPDELQTVKKEDKEETTDTEAKPKPKPKAKREKKDKKVVSSNSD